MKLIECQLNPNSSLLEVAKDEKEGNAWGIYDSRLHCINRTFSPILGKPGIEGLVDEIYSKHNYLRAMDLMGQGSVLKDLYADEGIAVSLSFDKKRMVYVGDPTSMSYVAGDIDMPETWNAVDTCLSGEKAHLSICRPVCGVNLTWGREDLSLGENFKYFSRFIERVVDRTEVGGYTLIESEFGMGRHVVERFAENKRIKKILDIKCKDGLLKIQKI